MLLRVAAGLLSQTLAEARAASWSILDSGPLLSPLLKCQRKIQFRDTVISSLGIIPAAAVLSCVRVYMLNEKRATFEAAALLFLSLFYPPGVCVETEGRGKGKCAV